MRAVGVDGLHRAQGVAALATRGAGAQVHRDVAGRLRVLPEQRGVHPATADEQVGAHDDVRQRPEALVAGEQVVAGLPAELVRAGAAGQAVGPVAPAHQVVSALGVDGVATAAGAR